jgi:hypothetical protein
MAGSRQTRRLRTRFTAKELLGGFGALLLTSDSDLALALADPLEALHGIVALGAGAGRVCSSMLVLCERSPDMLTGLSSLLFWAEAHRAPGRPSKLEGGPTI